MLYNPDPKSGDPVAAWRFEGVAGLKLSGLGDQVR
jgi:hypothetical protein